MKSSAKISLPRLEPLGNWLASINKPAVLTIETTLLAAIVLLALGARLLPGPRTIDDAYITFRYARNLLAGEGFVYNPGEHVLGTTTPLYAALLALLAAFTGGVQAPFPYIALYINALADALTCLLLYRLGQRLGAPRAGLAAALVWAIAAFSVSFAIGGMETSLCILLLVSTANAHLHRRRIPAALLAALSFLTRPDTLILIGPLALDRVWQIFEEKRDRGIGLEGSSKSTGIPPTPLSPNPLYKELLAFFLPILSWFLFATLYFGSPLPHSIAAKSLAYHLSREEALVRLLQHYATPFLEHLTFGVFAIGAGILIYPFLFTVGARLALRNEKHAWPVLAYPWLYFAVFALANPLIFRWYLAPPLPFYILGILAGIEAIGVELGRGVLKWKKPNPPVPPSLIRKEGGEGLGFERLKPYSSAILSIVFLLTFALSLHGWTLRPDHGLTRPAPEMAWYQLELLYRQAADLLAPELGADPGEYQLAAGDVGVLGFFTGARILDTVGLNSPVASRYYPLDQDLYTTNYAVPPNLILDQRPDFIVILEVYGREGLLKDTRFQQAYTLIQKIPTDIYGSKGMLIYKRGLK